MVFKWRGEQIVLLLDLLKDQECLWNVKSETYKDKNSRDEAIKQMAKQLNFPDLTQEDIKLKIKSILRRYYKELGKVLKSERSGADRNIYVPTLFFFKRADLFLRSVCTSILSSSTKRTPAQLRKCSDNIKARKMIKMDLEKRVWIEDWLKLRTNTFQDTHLDSGVNIVVEMNDNIYNDQYIIQPSNLVSQEDKESGIKIVESHTLDETEKEALKAIGLDEVNTEPISTELRSHVGRNELLIAQDKELHHHRLAEIDLRMKHEHKEHQKKMALFNEGRELLKLKIKKINQEILYQKKRNDKGRLT